MLKKSLSILFLIVVAFNMAGIFIVFKTHQNAIRKEIKQQIKAGIPEHELHIFKLSKKEYCKLHWVREDIEFRLGARMFDIVRSENLSDSIYLYCINDTEEAILFAELDDLTLSKIQKESKGTNNQLFKVVKIVKLEYITTEFAFPINYFFENQKESHTHALEGYVSPNLQVLIPPPDTV